MMTELAAHRQPHLDILLVSHGFPPESVGGVEQHVEGLAGELARRGHRVTVYARTGGPGEQGSHVAATAAGAPYEVVRVVYRYEGLDGLGDLYEVPRLDDALRTFLRGRRFDVAHVHHLTGMSTGLLEVLRAAGIPTALTLHDYWMMCPRGQMWHRDGQPCARVEPSRCADCLRPAFGGWLGERGAEVLADLHGAARRRLAGADRLVVPSARALPPFAELGIDPAAVTVVENGVDTEALRQLPPAAPRLGQPLRVGYLGTLIPSKGLDVLVAALQRLPPGTASLDVHGNAVPYHGDDGFLTRVFAALRPGDRVRYHGPYRGAELPARLAELDVVAAPALWQEAFGLTVREALAAGRPVVVSRIGGLQDAIEDGVEGRIVAPGDAGALAGALAELAADPARLRAMAGAARRRGRSFAAMTADLEAVYRGLVG